MTQQGHGLDEYTRFLDALDGRSITVTLRGQGGAGSVSASPRSPAPAPTNPNDEEYVRLLAQEVVVSELDRRGL